LITFSASLYSISALQDVSSVIAGSCVRPRALGHFSVWSVDRLRHISNISSPLHYVQKLLNDCSANQLFNTKYNGIRRLKSISACFRFLHASSAILVRMEITWIIQ